MLAGRDIRTAVISPLPGGETGVGNAGHQGVREARVLWFSGV